MSTPAPTGGTQAAVTISPDVIAKAEHEIIKARIKLLFNHPFFGQLALRLTPTPANPSWCPTAATDGRKLYYNPEFILNLDSQENVFLIAHELGHCIYEHFIRRGDRDPKLWNIAGDYIINNTLEDEIVKKGNYARVITYVQPYLDHKYDDWTTEEIYDDLRQQSDNGERPEDKGQLIDVHIDPEGDGDSGDDDGDGDGLAGKPTQMSEDEIKELGNELRDAMIQAAQAAGAGNVPAGIKRMLQELTEPQMDWREILRARIESSIKSDFTFLRPNRKGWHLNAVLPGMNRDFQIDVALAIDTSGSISQSMLTEFVSEIAGIMEQFEEYKIRIWQFDTAVYGYDEFTSDDGRDIREYEISGGGGTDFDVNFEYMKENEIEPDQFIMFTDGMPWNSWGDPDYCDTVFLIHTAYGKPEAPFGETVYYEAEKSYE